MVSSRKIGYRPSGSRPGGSRPVGSGRVGEIPSYPSEAPVPPGTNLNFHRNGIRWQFNDGKVWVDEFDVDSLISESKEEIGYWVGLAEGLSEYRKKMSKYAREQDQLERFEAVVEALLGKLMRRLKKSYDKKMTGLSWSLENGQFILNGINIRSLLALYRLRQTAKAKEFLRGLKKKLAMLLRNSEESPDYERVHQVVSDLYREIDEVVPEETHRSGFTLLPHRAGHQ